MGLVALSLLAVLAALSLADGRVWAGVVLTAWAVSALYLSTGLGDVGAVAWHMQSFGKNIVSSVSEGFRNVAHTLHAQSFGVDLEIQLLIGLGLVAAAAVYARRPLTA